MKRTTSRADANSVRQWNEFAVVNSLREHGPQRISDLCRSTGLTPAPLGQVLRGLGTKGWVSAGSPMTNGRGRPAQTFELRRPHGAVLGLDIGAHSTRAVRLTFSGEVVAQAEGRLPRSPKPEQRIALVEEVVREVAGDGPVWLTTIAVGGHLREDGTIERSVAIPEWDGLNPKDLFGDLLPSRAQVVNDVRAATFAEHHVGAAQGFQQVLVAQLGRRPTLGLLFGGAPMRGAHGTAGDMSLNAFLPTEDDMAWLHPFAESLDPIGEAVQAALDGDAAALAGARRYIDSITPALTFAASVVDPGVFVIAGALSPLAGHFIDDVEASFKDHLQQAPEMRISTLDQFSTAIGAGLRSMFMIMTTLSSATNGVAPLTLEEFNSRLAAAG